MKELNSSIYRVRIAHQRSRPRRHHLSYGAFYLLLDLDELDHLDVGKSCIRFKKIEDLPVNMIKQILVETVAKQQAS